MCTINIVYPYILLISNYSIKEVHILLSKLKRNFIVYTIITTVIFTVGMDLATRNNINHASNPPVHSLVKINFYEQLSNTHNSPLPPLYIKPFKLFAINKYEKVQKLDQFTRETKSSLLSNTELEIKTNPASTYEVTSHYLNIRENKNVDSKIINVVKNGDILEVLATTDNDWLQLKDGGYVNGKYTELISGQAISPETQLTTQTPLPLPLPLQKPLKITVNKTTNSAIPSKPTTIVKSDSKLTIKHITEIFEGTLLADHGLEETIIEIEREYGINAYFTIAVMKLESGHGKSKIARNKNNLFGLNAIDGDAYNKAFSFKTKGESVRKFGQLISDNYIDKGYTSIEKVAKKYCNANPKWSSLVMSIMKSDYKKLL